MPAQSEPRVEPPECTMCGVAMEHRAGGTERSVPLIGEPVEYEQFACPECGQGARFERSADDDEWKRAVRR